jgi:hypothetical protein
MKKVSMEEKEKQRLEYDNKRHKFESKNLGHFGMIYPVQSEETMQKYSEYLK